MREAPWVRGALVVAVLAATGCAEKRYAEVVVKEAYLESPEGERTPIGESRDEADRVHRPGWRRWTTVQLGDYSMTVRLSLASQRAHPERILLVSLHGRAEPKAHIVEAEAYYQLNRGPREPLVILPPEGNTYPATAKERGSSHHRLRFLISAPLSTYGLYMPGANLVEPTWNAIERDKGNTYTLHIPFVVGDARWVHHMKFEIRARKRYVAAAPATP
jgi:hypothetical protein